MPWRSPHDEQPPRKPAPVPDGELVRQQALAASWARDRMLARRRLVWRWTIWAALHYLKYLLAVVALLLVALWFFRSPAASAAPADRQERSPLPVPHTSTPDRADRRLSAASLPIHLPIHTGRTARSPEP